MSRRSSHHLIFDSLQLEGGLFVPAILEQAARGELAGQGAADYRSRVNRQPTPADQMLQEGDRISVTPTKIEGANIFPAMCVRGVA